MVFLVKFWFLKIQILQEKILSFATFRKKAYIVLKILIFTTLKIVNCIGTFEGKCQKSLYLIHSINYQTKLTILVKKKDCDQIFDTTMFLKSLHFALITRAFSKLL